MKTKKLNLLDFKKNEISNTDSSLFVAGGPIIPKPTSTGNGNGIGGSGGICYYDLDGELLYCTRPDTDEILPVVTNL